MTSYTVVRSYNRASVTNYSQTPSKGKTLTDLLKALLNKEKQVRQCTKIRVKEE